MQIYIRISINFNISGEVSVLQLGINISKEQVTFLSSGRCDDLQ